MSFAQELTRKHALSTNQAGFCYTCSARETQFLRIESHVALSYGTSCSNLLIAIIYADDSISWESRARPCVALTCTSEASSPRMSTSFGLPTAKTLHLASNRSRGKRQSAGAAFRARQNSRRISIPKHVVRKSRDLLCLRSSLDRP